MITKIPALELWRERLVALVPGREARVGRSGADKAWDIDVEGVMHTSSRLEPPTSHGRG